MTGKDTGGADNRSPKGFFHPVRSLLAALSAGFHTRLELFVTELEEERERLKQTLILTLLLFFGFSLGIILLTIFAVAIFWQQGWVYAVGVLAVLYLGIGAAAGLMLRKKILLRPGLFPSILNELARDRDRLRTSSRE
jgi:uncharacterized membrane protein YqjE